MSIDKSALDPSTPAEGYYRIKLVKGGIWVPVHIWYGPPADPLTGELLDRSWRWQVLRNDKLVPLDFVWPWCAGQPIDRDEYDYLLARNGWAALNAPETPEATPAKPIDLMTAPIPEF